MSFLYDSRMVTRLVLIRKRTGHNTFCVLESIVSKVLFTGFATFVCCLDLSVEGKDKCMFVVS